MGSNLVLTTPPVFSWSCSWLLLRGWISQIILTAMLTLTIEILVGKSSPSGTTLYCIITSWAASKYNNDCGEVTIPPLTGKFSLWSFQSFLGNRGKLLLTISICVKDIWAPYCYRSLQASRTDECPQVICQWVFHGEKVMRCRAWGFCREYSLDQHVSK